MNNHDDLVQSILEQHHRPPEGEGRFSEYSRCMQGDYIFFYVLFVNNRKKYTFFLGCDKKTISTTTITTATVTTTTAATTTTIIITTTTTTEHVHYRHFVYVQTSRKDCAW